MTALVPLAQTALPRDPALPAPEILVEQLLDRWAHMGAPATVLRKAERASPGFAARHAPIRTDRIRLANAAWLLAFMAMAATAFLTVRLFEQPIAMAEILVRVLVAGLLVSLAATAISRSSARFPLHILGLLALSLIYLAASPDDFALRNWDRNAVLLGWAIVVGKSVRMCLDRLLDRLEAELLIRAAGCR